MSSAAAAHESDVDWLSQLCAEAQAAEREAPRVVLEVPPPDLKDGLCNAKWFVTTRLAAEAGENKRTLLRCEYQDLAREHRAERAAAEELQASLSAEMRQLRDQCQEQGRTVGLLAQRLADARHAVTAELRGAAVSRAALTTELSEEEAQRAALEGIWRSEESEVGSRVEAAEQQLSTMVQVRDSLAAQLQASLHAQNELRGQIAAERSGRSEIEVAGERELEAWSEHNTRVYDELRLRLRAERSAVDTWREDIARELQRLHDECGERDQEEAALEAQVHGARELHERLEAELRAEAYAWHHEAEALRVRTRELDEECWRAADAARRCAAAQGACSCERAELQEEVRTCAGAAQRGGAELEALEQRSRFLQEELRQLQEGVARWKHDEEGGRLRQQRDELVRQIQEATQFQQDLEAELDEVKSRGIFCMFGRRQAGPPAPLPPPVSPPPTPGPAAGRTFAHSPPYQTLDGGRGVRPLARRDDARGPQAGAGPRLSAPGRGAAGAFASDEV